MARELLCCQYSLHNRLVHHWGRSADVRWHQNWGHSSQTVQPQFDELLVFTGIWRYMRSWTVFILNWLLDFAFKFTDVSVLGAEKVHPEGEHNDLTRFPLHWISSVTRLFPTQILYCLNFSTIGESENIWERLWRQTHLTRLSFTSEQAQAQLNQPRHHKQIKHFDKCSVQCHWPHRWLCKKDISNASLIDSIFVFS